MSDKPVLGGRIYREAIKALSAEITRLSKLIEELSKPGVDNGNRHRLKAEIVSSLLRQKEHLDILREIGDEARQDRRDR